MNTPTDTLKNPQNCGSSENKTPIGSTQPISGTTKTDPFPGRARRQEVLDKVQDCVCKDRQNTYGDAEDNFSDIAAYMTLWLQQRGLLAQGKKLESFDVAQLSSFIKIARKAVNPRYLDNWVDDAGYNVCGAGIVQAQFSPVVGSWVSEDPPSPDPRSQTVEYVVRPTSYADALSAVTTKEVLLGLDEWLRSWKGEVSYPAYQKVRDHLRDFYPGVFELPAVKP